MEHYPFNPTPEQRANLERLAAHLDLGVTNLNFDMKKFSDAKSYLPTECGTVACAAGHGPTLGITACYGEDWGEYIERTFGAPAMSSADLWMFGATWKDTDNTPRGAAARIRYALRYGIPLDHTEQRRGRATLSYTAPDRVEGPAAIKAREVAK